MKRGETHGQTHKYTLTHKQAALSERTEAWMQSYPVAVWPMTQNNTHTLAHEASAETEPVQGLMLIIYIAWKRECKSTCVLKVNDNRKSQE